MQVACYTRRTGVSGNRTQEDFPHLRWSYSPASFCFVQGRSLVTSPRIHNMSGPIQTPSDCWLPDITAMTGVPIRHPCSCRSHSHFLARTFARLVRFMLFARTHVIALLLICPLVLASATSGRADGLDVRDDFVQRLREPHSGRLDGQSLRIAIELISEIPGQPDRHLNVWLDRKVDPDAPVSPGPLGPTRYRSLEKVADSAGCVVLPIERCVLIGRAEWVAQTGRDLLQNKAAIKLQNPASNVAIGPIDVRWPALSTPTEAMRSIRHAIGPSVNRGAAFPSDSAALPHDLWPATRLDQVSPVTAMTLVAAQFKDPSVDNPEGEVEKRLTLRYRFAGLSEELKVLRKSHPSIKVTPGRGETTLAAGLAAHRLLCSALLSSAGSSAAATTGQPAGPPASSDPLVQLRNDRRTFSLKVENQKAGAVLHQLFSSAGVTSAFDPAANPSLVKLVSFEAKDMTLWELVHLITDQSSLKIETAEGKLLVSPRGE